MTGFLISFLELATAALMFAVAMPVLKTTAVDNRKGDARDRLTLGAK